MGDIVGKNKDFSKIDEIIYIPPSEEPIIKIKGIEPYIKSLNQKLNNKPSNRKPKPEAG